jgi:hypothetical protein
MKKEQAQQLEEHEWCNTPDCCMKCDTAVPVQLELFPELFPELEEENERV